MRRSIWNGAFVPALTSSDSVARMVQLPPTWLQGASAVLRTKRNGSRMAMTWTWNNAKWSRVRSHWPSVFAVAHFHLVTAIVPIVRRVEEQDSFPTRWGNASLSAIQIHVTRGRVTLWQTSGWPNRCGPKEALGPQFVEQGQMEVVTRHTDQRSWICSIGLFASHVLLNWQPVNALHTNWPFVQ